MTTFFSSFTLCTRQGHHEMGWSGSGVLGGGWCSPPFGMLSPLLGMSGAEQQRSCRLAFCQGYTVYFRPHMAGRRKYPLDKTDPRWWCARPGRRLRPPSHPPWSNASWEQRGTGAGLGTGRPAAACLRRTDGQPRYCCRVTEKKWQLEWKWSHSAVSRIRRSSPGPE